MNNLMSFESLGLCECLVTNITLKGAGCIMYQLVALEVGSLIKGPPTDVTSVRLQPSMSEMVGLQVVLL